MDQYAFQYNSYSSGFPGVSNRDFMLFASEVWMKSGDFAVVTNSIEHPDFPPAPGFVRGVVKNSGLYVEECGQGDRECIVTYVVQLDPKGMIPSWVANIVAINQPLVVSQIRNAIEARKKRGENVFVSRAPPPDYAILEPAESGESAPIVAETAAAPIPDNASMYSYDYSYEGYEDEGNDGDTNVRRADANDLAMLKALEAKVDGTRSRVEEAEATVAELERQLNRLHARARESQQSSRSCCAIQ